MLLLSEHESSDFTRDELSDFRTRAVNSTRRHGPRHAVPPTRFANTEAERVATEAEAERVLASLISSSSKSTWLTKALVACNRRSPRRYELRLNLVSHDFRRRKQPAPRAARRACSFCRARSVSQGQEHAREVLAREAQNTNTDNRKIEFLFD